MEIAVGVARRDLPLFSCSCIWHRPRVSDAACAAQRALGHLRQRRLPFFCAWWRAGLPETAVVGLAVEVEAGGAERDPWAKQTKVVVTTGYGSAG